PTRWPWTEGATRRARRARAAYTGPPVTTGDARSGEKGSGTRVVALSGGIGTGKSTVAVMLRARGAVVIDADEIVHRLQAPGEPMLAELAAAFGPEICDAGGALDRKRLGAIVFADPEARRRLNAIVHPKV